VGTRKSPSSPHHPITPSSFTFLETEAENVLSGMGLGVIFLLQWGWLLIASRLDEFCHKPFAGQPLAIA